MIEIIIPGFGQLSLHHLVSDFTGTLSCDGKLLPGVKERLQHLATTMDIHVLTADTFGTVAIAVKDIPCQLHRLHGGDEDIQKENYIRSLGPDQVVAYGNGNNDRKMLQAARLGIAILGDEGCASAAILAADIVVTSILNGLDLLLTPLRCKATLRF